jgi:hypothetical protein
LLVSAVAVKRHDTGRDMHAEEGAIDRSRNVQVAAAGFIEDGLETVTMDLHLQACAALK